MGSILMHRPQDTPGLVGHDMTRRTTACDGVLSTHSGACRTPGSATCPCVQPSAPSSAWWNSSAQQAQTLVSPPGAMQALNAVQAGGEHWQLHQLSGARPDVLCEILASDSTHDRAGIQQGPGAPAGGSMLAAPARTCRRTRYRRSRMQSRTRHSCTTCALISCTAASMHPCSCAWIAPRAWGATTLSGSRCATG